MKRKQQNKSYLQMKNDSEFLLSGIFLDFIKWTFLYPKNKISKHERKRK